MSSDFFDKPALIRHRLQQAKETLKRRPSALCTGAHAGEYRQPRLLCHVLRYTRAFSNSR